MKPDDFAARQAATARELGYGDDVAAMNAVHDDLHRALCRWLGVTSHAMRDAAGEQLTPHERELAWAEEDAVLKLQRFLRLSGADVPDGR